MNKTALHNITLHTVLSSEICVTCCKNTTKEQDEPNSVYDFRVTNLQILMEKKFATLKLTVLEFATQLTGEFVTLVS